MRSRYGKLYRFLYFFEKTTWIFEGSWYNILCQKVLGRTDGFEGVSESKVLVGVIGGLLYSDQK